MPKVEHSPFPWGDVMAFGFGHLRMSPAAFWALTPVELSAAMRAHGVGVAGSRSLSSLRKLIDRHETVNERH
ncbi:MAG: phage tail assembly chaperone [Pseudomonadota bacterium]